MGEHGHRDLGRGRDLGRRRAEDAGLQPGHLADGPGAGVERDQRQHGMDERAEPRAGGTGGVAGEVEDNNVIGTRVPFAKAPSGTRRPGLRPLASRLRRGSGGQAGLQLSRELGDGADAERGRLPRRDGGVAGVAPRDVRGQVVRDDAGGGVLADELLLAEAVAAFALEVERAGVPPDDGVRGDGTGYSRLRQGSGGQAVLGTGAGRRTPAPSSDR